MADTINASSTLNGSFGTIYMDGVPLSSFNECEVTDTKTYENILVPGTRRVKYKLKTIEGRGSIRGYRVTQDLIKAFTITDNMQDIECSLSFYVEDPEGETQYVTITGVKFTKNDIIKFKAGEIITEDWEFVFDGEAIYE